MNIIFMGTPEFAVPSLEAMVTAGYSPAAVVTGPDRPRGRGQKLSPTPIKRTAQKYELPVLQPESVRDPSFADAIRELAPDIIAVVAYRILPPEVFTQATLGAFNLHASLLPAFRGAAPINRAIMAGASETGVTTFFLQEKVDTGPIILKKRAAVGPNETAGELHDRLKQIGAEAVVETIRRIAADNTEPMPQDDALASAAPKIYREDCRIPWSAPAQKVHNHIRGLSPYPGAWTTHEDTLLKMYRSRIVRESGSPGTILAAHKRLVVACSEQAVEITELQQQGKSTMRTADFLNGYDLPEGAVLA